MTFGSLADTFMFFAVAFYQSSDPFMAEHWFSLGFVDYLFKLFVFYIRVLDKTFLHYIKLKKFHYNNVGFNVFSVFGVFLIELSGILLVLFTSILVIFHILII